ncbi:MAG: rhodanese-like domain-containing protein [Candidatus Kapaibacteriota bacterium]
MIKEISADELRAKLDSGADVFILDVRQPEEHAEQAIPGATLIPLGELEERISELDAYKDREIIVYCQAGGRSANACMFLQMFGFTNAVNLRGGILGW